VHIHMSSGYSSPVMCARLLSTVQFALRVSIGTLILILRSLFTGRDLILLLWEIRRIARCARVVEGSDE